MRKPTVKNKYNLTFQQIKKLKIGDRTKIHAPLFWRNNAINAWCVSGTTIKSHKDDEFGTYDSYWIGIYDEDSKRKTKLKVDCSSYGGMCTYNFKNFFDYKEIENEMDLEIQEKLLNKVNELIDERILILE